MQDNSRPLSDHSEPVVFPPVIPATGFIAGVVLQRLWPIRDSGARQFHWWTVAAASLLVVLGAAGFAWMVVTMKRARTPIHNAKTPTALVTTGPFAFSRNPMYLFGSTAYAGLALLLRQYWSLALLPVVLVLLHHGVVLREEQYLSRRFGRAYDEYRTRVRRWL